MPNSRCSSQYLFKVTDYAADDYGPGKGIDREARLHALFLHEACQRIGPVNRYCELGGGTTIPHVASGSLIAKKVIFTDGSSDACSEVEKWLSGESSFDWWHYMRLYWWIETMRVSRQKLLSLQAFPECCTDLEAEGAHSIKDRIRKKIKEVRVIDIRNPHPLGKAYAASYDVISANFVLEEFIRDKDEFLSGIENSLSLLRPGGFFIGCFLWEAPFWTVKGRRFSSYPVTVRDLLSVEKEFTLKRLMAQNLKFNYGAEKWGYKGYLMRLWQKSDKKTLYPP